MSFWALRITPAVTPAAARATPASCRRRETGNSQNGVPMVSLLLISAACRVSVLYLNEKSAADSMIRGRADLSVGGLQLRLEQKPRFFGPLKLPAACTCGIEAWSKKLLILARLSANLLTSPLPDSRGSVVVYMIK